MTGTWNSSAEAFEQAGNRRLKEVLATSTAFGPLLLFKAKPQYSHDERWRI